MAIKYATDIIKEIRVRGAILLPEDGVCGETFEKWLGESITFESEEFDSTITEVNNFLEVDNVFEDDYDYGKAA